MHVPFKGAGIAIASLLAGEVKLMYSSPPAVVMHVKAGRLRALGVTGSKRAAQAPEIPTFEESGVNGVEAYDSYGVLAPARTPRAIVARLNAKIIEALQYAGHRESLRGYPVCRSGGQHARRISAVHARRGGALGESDPRCQYPRGVEVEINKTFATEGTEFTEERQIQTTQLISVSWHLYILCVLCVLCGLQLNY